MTKIMVVEDDASLREIYSIRITAEGYDVVSASDGEEALAVAVREKPALILTDIMMPKISGFDMLDILRSTPEIANIKVIMMTALSADDQRQRGERLGADKYLVKSQVGIEDVINTIHEVLGDKLAPISDTVPATETASNNDLAPETTSTFVPDTEAKPAGELASLTTEPITPASGVVAPMPEPLEEAPALIQSQPQAENEQSASPAQ